MIYNSLLEIADNFDTFFFDAWGVFNIGGTVSQSTISVMAELVSRGKSVNVMSNTPQGTSGAITHYAKSGLVQGVHYHNMFSSGQLCRDVALLGELPVPGRRYYFAWDNHLVSESYNILFGTDYDKVKDISDADFIYCGFPMRDDKFITDPKMLEPELTKIRSAGLPIICTNPDLHAIIGDAACIMQGMICKILSEHNVDIIYYGKPHIGIYLSAMAKLGNPNPARTLMIGDTLHTDILGANRAGIMGCLTLMGGISAGDIIASGAKLTAENIYATASVIGASVDYIIRQVPSDSL